jgi:4-amino-4-deoxy-L-arabinose transferase-like glycosyltransferase
MTNSLRHTLIFVGAFTVLRLVALSFQSLNLGPDETQYWYWAQTPALGYFSKPPLIAWLIALTTRIFGDGEFGMRMFSPILHGLTALAIYRLADALYDARTALLSAIVYVTLPAVSLSAALITTDAPLLLCWALALALFVEALDKPTLGRAALLGLAIGLGMLAKYAMAYFVLCAAIAAIWVPGTRKLVLSRFGGLALLVAVIIFAPNIYWNATHHFPTVHHTIANADLGENRVNPLSLGAFLASQFAVFGPILFATLLYIGTLMVNARTSTSEPDRLLACFTFPVILIACTVAFLSRANGNWAAPAYVAATPLVVNALLVSGRRRLFAASLYLHVTVAVVFMVGIAAPVLADMTQSAVLTNGLKRVRGWSDLGGRVAMRSTEAPYTAILADDRELMGELLFYVRPRSIPLVMWDWERPPRNQYELADRIDEKTGARVLFVSLIPDPVHVLRRFKETQPLGPVEVRIDAFRKRTVWLFDLEGFRPQTAPTQTP